MVNAFWLALLDRAHRRFGDLKWRVTAVMARLTLWWQLPSPVADDCVRFSQYVAVRDKTKIAVDFYRPARKGVVLDEPLPVVWTFERYHRARFVQGRLRTRLDSEFWLKLFVRHGYVVGVADVRGSGASFGSRAGLITEQDRWDAYDITEWFAAQSWSNGRVGMFGKSFMGMTQYLAASTAPPHLVAIFPEKTLFDLYSFAYTGGVFRDDYARDWGGNAIRLDRAKPAAPVADDADGNMLSQAIAEHQSNCDINQLFSGLPFRDSTDGDGNVLPYLDQSPSRHRASIEASGVAIYQLAGWFDLWPRDALLWHCNLSNPRKLLLGPWAHTQDSGWKLFTERLRWFDHWLKGVENGVMDGAPIAYHTAGAPRGPKWRSANQWPLPNEQPTRFFFEASTSDDPANSGLLSEHPPSNQEGEDLYTVDYSTTSGSGTRWKNGYGREFGYSNMAINDAKGLTYTTPPLQDDLEITGHPIVCFWMSSTARDVDIFVYLEEVRGSGYSEYLTEGVLRASHRAETEPPFNNLRLPYHRSNSGDISELPESEPVCLTFDLHPLSRVFRRGHRIRVAITGADVDNAMTPVIDPRPRIKYYRNARYASYIVLPVIPFEPNS